MAQTHERTFSPAKKKELPAPCVKIHPSFREVLVLDKLLFSKLEVPGPL
jgi:hypothetical protein